MNVFNKHKEERRHCGVSDACFYIDRANRKLRPDVGAMRESALDYDNERDCTGVVVNRFGNKSILRYHKTVY